jgi:hypothetical protein
LFSPAKELLLRAGQSRIVGRVVFAFRDMPGKIVVARRGSQRRMISTAGDALC